MLHNVVAQEDTATDDKTATRREPLLCHGDVVNVGDIDEADAVQVVRWNWQSLIFLLFRVSYLFRTRLFFYLLPRFNVTPASMSGNTAFGFRPPHMANYCLLESDGITAPIYRG